MSIFCFTLDPKKGIILLWVNSLEEIGNPVRGDLITFGCESIKLSVFLGKWSLLKILLLNWGGMIFVLIAFLALKKFRFANSDSLFLAFS